MLENDRKKCSRLLYLRSLKPRREGQRVSFFVLLLSFRLPFLQCLTLDNGPPLPAQSRFIQLQRFLCESHSGIVCAVMKSISPPRLTCGSQARWSGRTWKPPSTVLKRNPSPAPSLLSSCLQIPNLYTQNHDSRDQKPCLRWPSTPRPTPQPNQPTSTSSPTRRSSSETARPGPQSRSST